MEKSTQYFDGCKKGPSVSSSSISMFLKRKCNETSLPHAGVKKEITGLREDCLSEGSAGKHVHHTL